MPESLLSMQRFMAIIMVLGELLYVCLCSCIYFMHGMIWSGGGGTIHAYISGNFLTNMISFVIIQTASKQLNLSNPKI